MHLILYNARKFEKRYEILSFKSLLNIVIKWEEYDEFVLEWCSPNYTIIRIVLLAKMLKIQILYEHKLKAHKYNRLACQSYCDLSEFTFVL